jgi:hypothetical protein
LKASRIDFKKIERCIKHDTVFVGFPSGRTHSSGIESATLAEWLSYGTARIQPGWDFLIDGMFVKKEELRKAIEESFVDMIQTGKSHSERVGVKAVSAIQEFVRGETYKSSQPNKEPYKTRKAKKGKDHPLIVDGDLINSITFVVKKR